MSRVFTEQEISEIQAAEAGLRDSGLDVDHEYATHNANLIMEYFEKNPSLPATVQNIYAFIESRKTDFVWRTAAQREYDRIAKQNPQAAQQLADWLATQGRSGTLVNTGEQGFENAANLLQELRGREINPTTIQQAITRIGTPTSRFSTRKRPPLHYVPQPRRTEPVSRAAKEDNGEPFLGRDLVKQADGSYRSKTPAEQRRDMEAAEKAKSQSQTPHLDASERAWKSMADGLLRDGTHSQQARVKAVYDRELYEGSGWRKIYEACKREVNLSKSRSFVR
jgi:hypothetical protein